MSTAPASPPPRPVSRMRVLAFATLGYVVVILTALVLAAGVVALTVSGVEGGPTNIFLVVGMAVLLLMVLGAIFHSFPEPEGQEVDRAEVPELFGLLDAVRGATGGPRLHRVVLTGEMNAGIVQVTRPGLVFGARNHLALGLPLLAALTPEDATAVLAHEYGHLRGAHGRVGAFIHRSRNTWLVLLDSLEGRGAWSAALARRFVAWYAPRLAARSWGLARIQEFEADAAAAEATSPDAVGRMLIRLTVAGAFLEESFWPSVGEAIEDLPEPPPHVMSAAARRAAEVATWPRARARAAQVLAAPADPGDVHPSLAERLAALGVEPARATDAALTPPGETALARYLGPRAAPLFEWLDGEWAEANRNLWRLRRKEALAARRRIEEIDALPPAERTADLEAEAARHLWALDDNEAAEARARRVLAASPRHPLAQAVVGHVLLERGDEAGLDHLSAAMVGGDEELVAEACVTAVRWLVAEGRDDEAEPFHRTLMRIADRSEEREEEVEAGPHLDADDPVEPHGLDAGAVARVRAAVLPLGAIVERAYLVRRGAGATEGADLVLVVLPEARWGRFWRDAGDELAEIVDRISRGLPEDPAVDVVIAPITGPLLERVAALPGALVYGEV